MGDAAERDVEEVGELEASGSLEAAVSHAFVCLERHKGNPKVQLCFASLMIRTQLEELAENEDSFNLVVQSLDSSSKQLSRALRQSADAETKRQASIAFGLKGILESRLIGDLQSAVQSLQKSLSYDENNVDTLYCLACILDQAFENRVEASKLYERILEQNSQHITTLNNYAALLIEDARTEDNLRAMETLSKAKDLLEKAQELAPGFPAYNLACVAATRLAIANESEKPSLLEECQGWLRTALVCGGIPNAKTLADDTDLNPVKETTWFKSFMQEVKNMYVVEFLDTTVRLHPPEGLSCKDESELQPASAMETEDGEEGAVGPPIPPKKQAICGTTGWTVWNASFLCIRFIEEMILSESSEMQAGWWEGKHVLDLSAGLGLVGLCCATLGAKTVLTDIGVKQLKTLQGNINLNGFDNVACHHLAWGDQDELDQVVRQFGPFDVVFASDLVYIGVRDNILDLLFQTTVALVQQGARLFMCFEERSLQQEQAFIEKLSQACTVIQHPISDDWLRDIGPDADEEDADEDTDKMFAGLSLHEMPTFKLLEIRSR